MIRRCHIVGGEFHRLHQGDTKLGANSAKSVKTVAVAAVTASPGSLEDSFTASSLLPAVCNGANSSSTSIRVRRANMREPRTCRIHFRPNCDCPLSHEHFCVRLHPHVSPLRKAFQFAYSYRATCLSPLHRVSQHLIITSISRCQELIKITNVHTDLIVTDHI
jgi:hypothetical protein